MANTIPRIIKIFSNIFVLILISIVCLFYYIFTFLIWIPQIKRSLNFGESLTGQFMLTIFHADLFMFIWSFIQCIITDPGRVPIYWVDLI